MNHFAYYVEFCTNSAGRRRSKRPRYALTVSLWLAVAALGYFAVRAV